MIKKYILSLGIILFGFLGFSYGAKSQLFMVGLDKAESNWDISYSIGFLPYGRFNSEYIGTVKPIIALDNTTFIFWAENKGLYLYSSGTSFGSFQGFYQYYYVCDEIGSSGIAESCNTPIHFDLIDDVSSNFVNSIKNGDYVLVAFYEETRPCGGPYCTYQYLNSEVCFSSSSIGKTLCFKTDKSDSTLEWYYANYPLTGNLHLRDINFASNFYGVATEPPLFNGSSNGIGSNVTGPSEFNNNNVISGSYIYSTCTNQDIILSLYNYGYTPLFCKGGIDNWDVFTLSGSLDSEPGTGKWLDDIYLYTSSTGQDYMSWFNYWNNFYQNPYVTNQNVWLSKPAVLKNWFYYYYQFGGPVLGFDEVYNFCLYYKDVVVNDKLLLNYNGNKYNYACSSIMSLKNDPYNVGSGVAVGVNRDGVGNRTGNIKTYNDGVVFIQDFFNLLKSNFPTRYGAGLGMLPAYIISFMLALMLFRFLRH